jgi:hypothetical protein
MGKPATATKSTFAKPRIRYGVTKPKAKPGDRWPYKTTDQFEQRIKECKEGGRVVKFDKEHPRYVFRRHPKSKQPMYTRTDTDLEKPDTLWTEYDGRKKQNLHEDMYLKECKDTYESVLKGGETEHRGKFNPQTNKDGFVSIIASKYLMSREEGSYVKRTFWDSPWRVERHEKWEAEREKLKAERREMERTPPPPQLASPVHTYHSGSYRNERVQNQINFNAPMSPEAMAAFAAKLSPPSGNNDHQEI